MTALCTMDLQQVDQQPFSGCLYFSYCTSVCICELEMFCLHIPTPPETPSENGGQGLPLATATPEPDTGLTLQPLGHMPSMTR